MISATAWVPRGIASEFPETYELNDEEMARIEAMSSLNLQDAKADLENAEQVEGDEDIEIEIEEETEETINSNKLKDQIDIDDDLKEYDFEHYDDEDNEDGEKIVMFPGLSNSAAKYIKVAKKQSGNGGEEEEDEDVEFVEGEEDHYLQLPTEEEENEVKAELQIYPTDNLILATRTEDDVSYLDVYVYDDGAGALGPEDEEAAEEEKKIDEDVKRGMVREGNLYIHHDLMLPSFPLCVEWMSFKPNGENDVSNIGNFAAIGTFEPTIEIWNLDCIDKAFPDVILGENEYAEWSAKNVGGKGKKGNKKKKTNKISSTCHTDAVVSLSHNHIFRNVLCSTSADSTVKLWDLSNCKVNKSIEGLHNGKTVSSSLWFNNNGNDVEGGSLLLTGGYDGYMRLSDVRLDDVSSNNKKFSCGSEYGEEVESISKMGEYYVMGGCDSGNIYCYDIRKDDEKPLWTLHAHDSGISTLSSNKEIPGLIATGAMGEKVVKVWNVKDNKPRMILSKDFGCGNILNSSFADEIEVSGNLIIGGSNNGGLKMWDVFSNATVQKSFKEEIHDLQNRAVEEANKYGRVSRIARKYKRGYGESVVEPEAGGLEASEEAEEDEE
ncbi:rRNA-processing protein [Pichia kluyveri]|uniref:rRNA-processing protein n=1 Tax=Pichia kluyveri TaxID=36015 RepID=A0AAV5R6K2_PICKL|nr:rRNA-processing protein [Pichia kluyveri]